MYHRCVVSQVVMAAAAATAVRNALNEFKDLTAADVSHPVCDKCHKFYDGSLADHAVGCSVNAATAAACSAAAATATAKRQNPYWVKCALHKQLEAGEQLKTSVGVLKNCQFQKGGCWFNAKPLASNSAR
jgi:hypothetical protein